MEEMIFPLVPLTFLARAQPHPFHGAERGLHVLGFMHAWVEIYALRKICDHTHRGGGGGRDVICIFDALARFFKWDKGAGMYKSAAVIRGRKNTSEPLPAKQLPDNLGYPSDSFPQ